MARFTDPLSALEELDYLVQTTGISHRLKTTRRGEYRVSPIGSPVQISDIAAELSFRNCGKKRVLRKRIASANRGRVKNGNT